MSGARTLADIRKGAPEEDRNNPALNRKTDPNGFRPANTLYVPIDRRPRDLEQLSRMVGPYAEAAAVDAIWGAVTVWLMRDGYEWTQTHGSPIGLISTSVILCKQDDAWRFGCPNIGGDPTAPVLHTLSQEVQEEARRVGAEVIAAWESAGSPHLINAIERTHKYIHACIRAEAERNAA